MSKENINQEFRLKKIDKIRNYLIEEKIINELILKNRKNVCSGLNCTDHLLIVIFTITGCVSISAFASLVDVPIGIMNSSIGLKICAIAAGIKKYTSRITKKKKSLIK